jgi:hypothetical protein
VTIVVAPKSSAKYAENRENVLKRQAHGWQLISMTLKEIIMAILVLC